MYLQTPLLHKSILILVESFFSKDFTQKTNF